MTVRDRLQCAAAHVAAIRRMVEDDVPCPAVMAQIGAVRGALRAVARLLVADEVRKRLGAAGVENAADVTNEVERLLRVWPGRDDPPSVKGLSPRIHR